MTIKELISDLQKYNDDMNIFIYNETFDQKHDIEITPDDDNNLIIWV